LPGFLMEIGKSIYKYGNVIIDNQN